MATTGLGVRKRVLGLRLVYGWGMPRPIRIEYDNAYDHVMSRGRRRQCIFHTAAYDHAFLDTLVEAHERFGFVIHGYGLMGQYPLFLQTPHGN